MKAKVRYQVVQGGMGEERILGKRDGVPEGSFETEAEAEELASNIPGDMMGTAFRFVRKVWIP